MEWTWRRVCLLILLGMIYAQRLYQYLLSTAAAPYGNERPVNIVPLRTISEYFTSSTTPLEHRVYECAGNLLVFAPIAVVLALTMRPARIWPIFTIGFFLSTSVEILQYSLRTWRSADIDDVVCNTGGAVLVYLIAVVVLDRARPEGFPRLRRGLTASAADAPGLTDVSSNPL